MLTGPASLRDALSRTPVEDFDVAVIATTWDGTIGYWNAEAERIYGWTADEVIGQNIVDVTPSVSKRVQAEAVMGALRLGKPWEGEMLLRRRGGQVFNAFVIDTPLPANDPDACAIIGASGPAVQADKVRDRNALLICELQRHLGEVWNLSEDSIDWAAVGPPGPANDRYYRCYLTDGQRHIGAVREGMFGSDEDALAFGRAMLESMPTYLAAEVWNFGRLVGRVSLG